MILDSYPLPFVNIKYLGLETVNYFYLFKFHNRASKAIQRSQVHQCTEGQGCLDRKYMYNKHQIPEVGTVVLTCPALLA